MNHTKTSRYISLILRHQPEVIGITLDEHGWADVNALIEGVNRTHPLNREILEEIVRTDEKQRYSFNADHTKIRANQGHSIPVDVELKQCEPPEILYHGTGEKYVSSILKEGLIPKSRLYVHLSKDEATAKQVGSRHGKPAVFAVEAGEMHRQGHVFFLSENGVWLVKHVPASYLHRLY
ncbi:MAG TPA: RNA 2'-phosphotransferase [Erysipelotrichaceae bacterium]|nr:RNA 2'-phosphotransferase [Erysipelotrichaceae bacterium]